MGDTHTKTNFKIVLLVFCILIGSAFSQSRARNDVYITNTRNEVDNFVRVNTLEYQPHSSIFIDDNGDFETLGFNGSGTENNPYLIEGWNITESGGGLISISGTTSYFVIRNCLLKGMDTASIGINFNNVINGNLENNTISNLIDTGINLGASSNQNMVIGNTIHDNGMNGIRLDQSSNNILLSNIIFNVGDSGIGVWHGSNENYIFNNTIFDNSVPGIQVWGSSMMNDISSNRIYFNAAGITIGNESPLNTIQANIIYENNDGITVYGSDTTVMNNHIYDNAVQGLIIWQTDRAFISNNTIHNNQYGIDVWGNSNYVTDNIVYNGIYHGIGLHEGKENIVTSNQVYDNAGIGLALWGADNNVISGNIINGNGGGIELASTNMNTISYNTIFNNGGNGIDLSAAEDLGESTPFDNRIEYNAIYDQAGVAVGIGAGINTVIVFNVFSNNTVLNLVLSENAENSSVVNNDFIITAQQGITQMDDNGINNLVYNNYWSTCTGPDQNGDGIVDNPYLLNGGAGNADNAPRTEPNDPDLTYIILTHISASLILQPTPGEERLGVVSIEWTTAVDNNFHSISYSVLFSEFGGNTWNLLKSDFAATSYLWDTRTVQDGEYVIKIVQTDSEGLEVETVMEGSFKIINSKGNSKTPTIPLTNFSVILFALIIPVILKKRREN